MAVFCDGVVMCSLLSSEGTVPVGALKGMHGEMGAVNMEVSP